MEEGWTDLNLGQIFRSEEESRRPFFFFPGGLSGVYLKVKIILFVLHIFVAPQHICRRTVYV